jgi:hypothetical protein
VLLDADPTTDVANFHGIAAVVRAGTYYSADALDAIKTRTEHRIATAVPSTAAIAPPCC